MSKTLVGSRYELHVAREGAEESRKRHDYLAVYPGDLEEGKDEGEEVSPGSALAGRGRGGGRHRG